MQTSPAAEFRYRYTWFNQYSEVCQNDRAFEVYYPPLNFNNPIKYRYKIFNIVKPWPQTLSP